MAYQAGHRTLAQVARESWSIPWALRNQPESPGTDGGPRGPWDTGPGCPGQLVDPPGTRSGVGVPRTNSRPRGPSDPSASHPGVLVDIAVPRTRARVAWDTLSTPHAIGAGPEPPRISGRSRAQVTRTIWGSHWTWDTGPVARTNGLPSGPADTGPSRPGERVDPLGTRSRAGVPGSSGEHRGPSDPGPSLPGELVNTTGPQTRARVAPECWSVPRDIGHGRESPWTAGRLHVLSVPSACGPGQMVDTAGPWTKAQGALEFGSIRGPSELGVSPRDSWSNSRDLGHGPESLRRAS